MAGHRVGTYRLSVTREFGDDESDEEDFADEDAPPPSITSRGGSKATRITLVCDEGSESKVKAWSEVSGCMQINVGIAARGSGVSE